MGYHALRCIIRHPELELAGLWVHSPEKVGRDAGDLADLDPVGRRCDQRHRRAARHSTPTCVCYTATADLRPEEALAGHLPDPRGRDERGVDVDRVPRPPAGGDDAVQQMVDRLEAACREGGTSCFTSGIDPGFANDLLPHHAHRRACERIESVRIQEILNYATYEQPEVLFDTMGFGQPLDRTPLLLLPGVLGFAWGGGDPDDGGGGSAPSSRRSASSSSGATVDRDIVLAVRHRRGGHPGRVAVRGAGHRRRRAEDHRRARHPARRRRRARVADAGRHAGLLPHHRQGLAEPRLPTSRSRARTATTTPAGSSLTAMRVLNAIPAVVAAAPGVLSALDLPILGGHGSMHQTQRP